MCVNDSDDTKSDITCAGIKNNAHQIREKRQYVVMISSVCVAGIGIG